jgi:hypothetical protein
MIGPGWMPSRPRPLPRPAARYLPRWRTRRPRRRMPAWLRDLVEPTAPSGSVVLPVATLRPTQAGAWRQAAAGDLQRWLAARWRWLAPRRWPIAVACAALFAIPHAVERAEQYARGEPCELVRPRPAPLKARHVHEVCVPLSLDTRTCTWLPSDPGTLEVRLVPLARD